MAFRYRAIDHQGRLRRGRHAAVSLLALERALAEEGCELITATPARAAWRQPRVLDRRQRITFIAQLEQLLSAGLPMQESLDELLAAADGGTLASTAAELRDAVTAGLPLSQAMQGQVARFPPLVVSLVRAGEATGRLTQTLQRLLAELRWHDAQLGAARRALLYPAMAASALGAALCFLLLHVVPQLVDFLLNLGQPLPWQTRALLRTADGLATGWPWLLALPVAGLLLHRVARRVVPAWSRHVDRLALRLPVVGRLLQQLMLARLCRVLAICYATGIGVLEGLALAAEAAGNRALEAALREASVAIAAGNSLSASLAGTGLLPRALLRTLRLAETAGTLDITLAQTADAFSRAADEQMAFLQTLLSPALLVVLGAFLLWIVAAVFAPLYDMFAHLHA